MLWSRCSDSGCSAQVSADYNKENGKFYCHWMVFINVAGLFRDSRYWEYGHLWRVELTVGDQIHTNGDRPLTYNIYRPFIANETEEEIDNYYELLWIINNPNNWLLWITMNY